MNTIKLSVSGQVLSRINRMQHIVAGSKGYLRCSFEFDESWNALAKAAAFYGDDGTEHAAAIENGTCSVPDEVTDSQSFKVRVIGAGGKAVRVSTNCVTIDQEVM